MKPGKACDTRGVVAEIMKSKCESLLVAMLELFNDVFFSEEIPETLRAMRLVVLFKKGDPRHASNYRPTAILPILYKVFSRMLCNRVKPGLLSQQSVAQATYRPG